MKIDRRLREYKKLIEDLCKSYNMIPPRRVYLMRNYAGKNEVNNSCLIKHNNFYDIKIRKFNYEGANLIERCKENIEKSIYKIIGEANKENE